MTLSRLRIEEISLFNYIKYEVLGYSFVEQLSNVSLSYNSTLGLYMPDYSSYSPSPVSTGRGWVLFNESGSSIDTSTEQTSRVNVIGSSNYRVNYLLGGIESSETPTSASFYWNYIAVVNGWPGDAPPPVPIVGVDIYGSERGGYQLGSGFLQRRLVNLHIFASDSAERQDITETLFASLYNKSTSLIDYSEGDYLDYDGFYDSSFSHSQVNDTSDLYFEDVSSKHIDFPGSWSDIDRYRAVISFQMSSYIS